MEMRLFMETTRIAPEKSAGELCALLGRSGAAEVTNEYDGGEVIGVKFVLRIGESALRFRLPVRVQAVFEILCKARRHGNRQALADQAKRVAWRQILRWAQAQLALVQTGMVQTAEVFLPYMQVQPGQTLFERMVADGPALLTWSGEAPR